MGSHYFAASKLGSIVQLPDGRIGTTVYNGLDGIGIKWGRHKPSMDDFKGKVFHLSPGGNIVDAPDECPAKDSDWPWMPDAMLRDPYPGADLECVGHDFELLVDDEEETEVGEPA